MTPEEAVQEYQCPGCVNGPYPSCFKNTSTDEECSNHVLGTIGAPYVGKFFLGMPKGFNRIGQCKSKINIFSRFVDYPGFDWLNIPVWKHLDKHGNTLVRGLSPRLNDPWLFVFLEDCRDKIDCHEVTDKDLKTID